MRPGPNVHPSYPGSPRTALAMGCPGQRAFHLCPVPQAVKTAAARIRPATSPPNSVTSSPANRGPTRRSSDQLRRLVPGPDLRHRSRTRPTPAAWPPSPLPTSAAATPNKPQPTASPPSFEARNHSAGAIANCARSCGPSLRTGIESRSRQLSATSARWHHRLLQTPGLLSR